RASVEKKSPRLLAEGGQPRPIPPPSPSPPGLSCCESATSSVRCCFNIPATTREGETVALTPQQVESLVMSWFKNKLGKLPVCPMCNNKTPNWAVGIVCDLPDRFTRMTFFSVLPVTCTHCSFTQFLDAVSVLGTLGP